MTIRRQLFFSNVRILLLSFATLVFIGNISAFIIFRTGRPYSESLMEFIRPYRNDMRLIWILGIAFFIILISVVNNYYTHRMSKRIIKPLEPLSEGVHQINESNFSYRINYRNDDEFRPICDAFNEMAAKLETSAVRRQKEEANRRELIAGISHDLRTPLTSIKGCLEGIETGVASTPEMKDRYLKFMKNKTADLEHIIEQLFLFSKLDMDEFPLSLRRTDITAAVCDMIENSRAEYSSRGMDIKITGMPENVYVNADVIMLRNVIINIFENSVKYKTKKTVQMKVSAAAENNDVLLSLADNGPGVQADFVSKLFNAFYRTDPSRSRQGSGLGLTICGKIIERMGGSINAELPETGGLTIIIRLPLIQENGNA
ncbi:MAG: ATP-binding protein [Treponema sp.]|nr:ATP-binding protein [Treponema sp.]